MDVNVIGLNRSIRDNQMNETGLSSAKISMIGQKKLNGHTLSKLLISTEAQPKAVFSSYKVVCMVDWTYVKSQYLPKCPRNFLCLARNTFPYITKVLHDVFITMLLIFHVDCIVCHRKDSHRVSCTTKRSNSISNEF